MNRLAHRLWFDRDVARADVVTSNFAATAHRLEQLTGSRTDLAVKPCASPHFRADSLAGPRNEATTSRYLLSAHEPRKNLAGLTHAYLALSSQGRLPGYRLVLVLLVLLVGSRKWGNTEIDQLIHSATAPIEITGFVTDTELVACYRNAAAFILPSFYEGFGIPVVEALACRRARQSVRTAHFCSCAWINAYVTSVQYRHKAA